MEFTLYYHGELHSNGGARHKHDLRKAFHGQLKELWQQHPLTLMQEYLQPSRDLANLLNPHWASLLVEKGAFQFAPLVSEQLHLVAELELFLLQPSEPGKILSQAADIDNRLKTLFDALQMPDSNQMPEEPPSEGESPFFCVLENDRLITKVSIRTGRLLEPTDHSSEVRLFLNVNIHRTQFTHLNQHIG